MVFDAPDSGAMVSAFCGAVINGSLATGASAIFNAQATNKTQMQPFPATVLDSCTRTNHG